MKKSKPRLADSLKEIEPAITRDRELDKLKRDGKGYEAKYKHVVAQLEAAEARCELLAGLKDTKPVSIKPLVRSKAGNATAVIVLSDWHVEECVSPEKINHLNEFNLQVAQHRIERTFQKALMLLEDARHLASITEVVVAVIGDLISGYIHEELVEENELAPLPATRFASKHLRAGIDLLLREAKVERITVPTCYGNHGRTTQKMRVSTGDDNSFEQNLYYQLRELYQPEPRVVWKIESGYHNWLEIQGRHVRFHHGDAIKYGGGVGGITIPVNKAIAQWDRSKRADLDVFGHFHQFMWQWKFVANGCLIGYNPYALRIKADYQPPTQSFIVIDRDNGVTRAVPIFCT